MEYIRWYKNSDTYRKETRHCIYGQDADLIMLSLLSHEPNFTIIREEVQYKREQVEGIIRNEFIITKNFQLLYLPLLREYLDMEFRVTIERIGMEYNLERIIDDIIFLCFFVGNDFLPSLSVLDIAEASVDTLFELYKDSLPEINDYITENGLIYWDRAEKLIKALSTHELSILHSRMQKIMNFEKRAEDQEAQFFKGVERIHYFKLKEKKAEMIKQKKRILIERLKREHKDKEYKHFKQEHKPRDLVRMQIEVKKKATTMKKKRANNPEKYSSNTKFNFAAFAEGDEEEDDDENFDWISDNDRGQADDVEDEGIEREEVPTKHKEESKIEQKSEEGEEVIDTTAKDTENTEKSSKDEETKDPNESSDLSISDINDSEVSDVDIEELADIEEEVEGSLSKDMMVQLKLAEESRKKNQSFVKNLWERYKENPFSAKAYYYKEKVSIDVYTEDGAAQRDEMLRQYLIGMQWVLFYYYKGVQHWGFYYKYHYPPMISDIKDINLILGSTTIENFDMCESVNEPFFPYQQLLTILPPDSIQNLLPKCYYTYFIESKKFDKFYPLTFDMDLNGRSMPWESIILIPFIDEKELLNYESILSGEGKLEMSEKDVFRNQRGKEKLYTKVMTLSDNPIPVAEFKGFSFGEKNKWNITPTDPPSPDYVGKYFIDYKMTHTDIWKDFPSMHNLDIAKVALLARNMRGTKFEIPQIYIDDQKAKEIDLDKLAKDFVNRKRDAIYIDYPFKHEAFIYSITTLKEHYNVFDCWMKKTQKGLITETTDQQWFEANSYINRELLKNNIHVANTNVIIGFNRVIGIEWNSISNSYEKEYKPEVEYLPLPMISLDRHKDYYLDLEYLINDPLKRFEPMKNCIVLDKNLYGLTGQIKQVSEEGKVNEKFQYYDVNINVSKEKNKVRDLFFGRNICKQLFANEPKYSSVDHICKKRQKSHIVINRITSSILIKYMEGKERKTVDIGLKLRNNNQKLHIPFDVIYAEKFDSFKAGPIQFWGFSKKAEDVIIDYLKTFPWIEHYVESRAHHEATLKISKYHKTENRMNTIEDAMPFIETEEERLKELKKLTDWLNGWELSKRSFVPAGFRFLSTEARDEIDKAITEMKGIVTSKIPHDLTKVDPRLMFSEVYPFWCSPYKLSVKDFRFGDRVANINTTKRKYIPFGELGTVVGTTLDGIIVRFDEPYVSLTDVHDTCPPYTGAVVKPESLMNLTLHAENNYKYRSMQNVRATEESKGGYYNKQKKYYNPNQKHNKDHDFKGTKFFPQGHGGAKHEAQGKDHKKEHGEHHDNKERHPAATGPRFGNYNPKKMNKKKGTYYGYEEY